MPTIRCRSEPTPDSPATCGKSPAGCKFKPIPMMVLVIPCRSAATAQPPASLEKSPPFAVAMFTFGRFRNPLPRVFKDYTPNRLCGGDNRLISAMAPESARGIEKVKLVSGADNQLRRHVARVRRSAHRQRSPCQPALRHRLCASTHCLLNRTIPVNNRQTARSTSRAQT